MRVFRLVLLVLSSCSAMTLSAQAPATSVQLSAGEACRTLKGMRIPASSVGLPTTGARVRSAKPAHEGNVEFCKVLGEVNSVDPQAQPIRFEVNLPTNWNGKAVQFGGGGFDGWLGATDGLDKTLVSEASAPDAIARGFVTFGGDSGHHKRYFLLPDELNAVNASFALNDEERRNFAHDGIKKTHDAAVAIVERRYGRRPSRMFFLGGSTGGREAYFAVQRWPLDYDGVMGAYAGWDQTELDLQFIRVSEAMYAKGGFLGKAQTKLLARSVMKQCDKLDGVEDGMIANVSACHFDPATLLCPAAGKGCLSQQQLHTVETFATEQKTAHPLWNGVQTMPGYNVLSGTDLTGSMGLLHHAEHPPKIILNSFYYVVADQVLRFFVTKDRHFDTLSFDPTTGGKYADELLPQSKASDASDSDLSAYAAHGGKFLILHGTADATIPTNSSVLYYHMLQQTMGQDAVNGFVRFYLIPGYGHGHGAFDARFDALGVLDRWLDSGNAPEHLSVTDHNRATMGRTRPLCVYPAWPKYKGSGDVNAADSFTCVVE